MKPKNIITFPSKKQKHSSTGSSNDIPKEKVTSLLKYKMAKKSAGYQQSAHFEDNADKSRSEQNTQKPDLVIEKSRLLKNFQTQQSNRFPFMVSSISTGLFLLVASVVMFNRSDIGGDRGIAHVYNRQQHIIKSIQNGNREISSIGEKPGPLEIFTFEKLQSRYDVQGEEGKLMRVTLLENKEPVRVPSIENFIQESKLLFPNYDSLKKEFGFSDNQYTYELIDPQNQNRAFVEVTTDKTGGLLSIYVRR